MTIPAGETSKTQHIGNGVADTFDYEFKIADKDELLVIQTDDAGVDTPLTVDVDYTVAGVGDNNGGEITLLAGALADGYGLTIQDDVPTSQETPFGNQSDFSASSHERAFDKLTRLVLKVISGFSRTIRIPTTVQGVSTDLPKPTALNLFRWNSDANALENVSPADIATTVAFSDFIVQNFKDTVDYTSGTTQLLLLDSNPNIKENTWVYFDGVYVPKEDYSLANSQLNFNDPIPMGVTEVEVVSGEAVGVDGTITPSISKGSVAVTEGQTVVTVPFNYSPNTNTLIVIANGSTLENSDFTEQDTTITTGDPLPAGSVQFIGLNTLEVGTTNAANVTDETAGQTVQESINEARPLANIEALKALTGATVGDIRRTLSYESGGIGGGRYIFQPPNTHVNGVNGQSADGSYLEGVGGQWEIVVGKVFDVYQFGAVGDNVADDYDASQNAINLAEAMGGAIVVFPVPSVAYHITKVLEVPNIVSLVGLADRQRRIRIRKSTNVVSTTQGTGTSTIFPNAVAHLVTTIGDGTAWRGKIQNLEFDGDNVCEYGVWATKTIRSNIDNNTMSNCTTLGFYSEDFFLGSFTGNHALNVAGGFCILAGTSTDFRRNYVNGYTATAYDISLRYTQITNNAADKGGVDQDTGIGFTDSYATAYRFGNCDGSGIYNNGAEQLNGIFLDIRNSQSASYINNRCIFYRGTYTGVDPIGIITIDQCADRVTNNYVSADVVPSTFTDRFDIRVTDEFSDNAFDLSGNQFVNDSGNHNNLQKDLNSIYGAIDVPARSFYKGVGIVPINKTLYVTATGDDSKDGSDVSNAVASISSLLSRIHPVIEKTITVDLNGTTITEDIDIENLSGGGELVFTNGTLEGDVTVTNCPCRVVFETISVDTQGSGSGFVYTNSRGELTDVTYTRGTGARMLQAVDNSHVSVNQNTYVDSFTATYLRARNGAVIIKDSGVADGNCVGDRGGVVLNEGVN